MTAPTATPVRYTTDRIDGTWAVLRVTDAGREPVAECSSREWARPEAHRRNEEAARRAHGEQDAALAAEAAGDLEVEATEPEPAPVEEAPVEEAPVVEAPAAPVERVAIPKHLRSTLARVSVGDRLVTELDEHGRAVSCRFTDGTVRTVAEVTTRKATGNEMPGTLYVLVFEDGTVTEERYGTTSHYRAEVLEQVAPAAESTEAPAPKAPKAKKPAAPKVATEPSRAGKLVKGSRLVLWNVGVVTVDGASKMGAGRLEVAYLDADGEPGVREMWSSTNVRVATA
ncbi:hypothetical protein SAMN05660642_04640 [Geodermatophilus siccatus]|uniref:Uncharacterized protein n=1 Tax=Geodermatophilus siccatus TaxID=1137991 RepID=A0A1H0ANM7_9ACTN|nr:hypothetical protein [Geodermatophilus siccatus]SDN35182.1 hypothetical protein SAMN05660642_04640 [Geodermatophilus siccatus]